MKLKNRILAALVAVLAAITMTGAPASATGEYVFCQNWSPKGLINVNWDARSDGWAKMTFTGDKEITVYKPGPDPFYQLSKVYLRNSNGSLRASRSTLPSSAWVPPGFKGTVEFRWNQNNPAAWPVWGFEDWCFANITVPR